MQRCPLCQNLMAKAFFSCERKEFGKIVPRDYFCCGTCGLAFLHPEQRLNHLEEKQRYETHDNDITQAGYRQFLQQLWGPLREHLGPRAEGLDFGCGPTKSLASLAAGESYSISSFDPYFYPDWESLKRDYDFVFCSEVVEHFCTPLESWTEIFRLCRPHGVVGVMTSLLMNLNEFPKWHYHQDLTHVVFYQPKTILWISNHFSRPVNIISDKVMLFSQ